MAINEVSKHPIQDVWQDDMTGQDDSLAAQALLRFLADRTAALRQVSGGLSGGGVYQCSTSQGIYALKQWPASTAAERLDEVHAVQQFASRSCPLVPRLVPGPEGICRVSLKESHFDLSSWMPGAAFALGLADQNCGGKLEPASTADAMQAVKNGAAAIAHFHRATRALGVCPAIAPAVIRRLQRLTELKTAIPAATPTASRIGGAVGAAASYLAKHGLRLIHEGDAVMRPWASRPVEVQWVLRDVHREHVLFEQGEVSGIVDFDAVRQDTRATDLARWVGSFAELGIDPNALWAAAVSGYVCVREISAYERQLAVAIEQASWVIQLANWVVWSGNDSQEIPGGIESAQHRVGWLLRRSDIRLRGESLVTGDSPAASCWDS